MKADIEIAKSIKLKPVEDLLQIDPNLLEKYGPYKAKIDYENIKSNNPGKLILVTAVSPTPAGEGKTTTNIGLSMAINRLGHSSISVLREPSLGPVFGMKGGATGGGFAQVLPMEDINLHFTGDFHAITSSNNLLAAMIDNHIYHGNDLKIDPNQILFKRVMDMNDRALRNIELGEYTTGFDITVASEIMAILCLSEDLHDLKTRLGEILVAYDFSGNEIYAKDLNAVGAMTLLLKDAIKPNLVQTTENTPAIIHGGPFANIAHGANSIIATKTAMRLCDYTVTEAGFGSDLGAEKFMNIKARESGLTPNLIVLVVTMQSLEYHSGYDNLIQHIDHLKQYNIPVLVVLNQFPTDDKNLIIQLKEFVESHGVAFSISDIYNQGSKGGLEFAKQAVELANHDLNEIRYIYETEDSLETKINKVVKCVYGGTGVVFSDMAWDKLQNFEREYGHFNVCMAKTQYSFTDNPKLLGAPSNFKIHINDLKLARGAGFVIALSGKILTMPGLPKKPAAENIDYLEDGTIVGLS